MITVAGHADLAPESLTLVERQLRQVLEHHPEHRTGLVRAGAGAPLAFGRALATTGRRFVAVLPVKDGLMVSVPTDDLSAARELLKLAASARLQPFDPADRSARITVDEQLVVECHHVLAVWDGTPTDGRDATAHLVAYARARGIPVDIVWPRGATRTNASPTTAADVQRDTRQCDCRRPDRTAERARAERP